MQLSKLLPIIAVTKTKNSMIRYFIVMYTYAGNGSFGQGISYVTKNTYVNAKEFTENVKKDNPGFKSLVISNIIELSREDFETFKAD